MNITKMALVTVGSLALAYVAGGFFLRLHQPRNLSRSSTISPQQLKRMAEENKLHHDANTAWHKKNLPEAERLFRKALANSTSDADAWIGLGRLMDEEGRYREALAFYDGFLGPHPLWSSSEQQAFRVLTRYADLCDMFGRSEDATKACLMVLHTNPDATKNYLDDSNMFVRTDVSDPEEIRARAHILTGMWMQTFSDGYPTMRPESTTSALRFYREAVRLTPDLPIAHYYLAQGLKHFGHKVEARTEMALAERLGDDTFRAAMTAQVRNKEEEHKRFEASHPGHPIVISRTLSHDEVKQMVAHARATLLKNIQEQEAAKKAKVALKDKPQPQP